MPWEKRRLETVLTSPLSAAAEEPAQDISSARFDEIIRQHQRRVYRTICLLVKDPDAADTLTQECFLRAYRHRNSFRGECAIETWLLRIAVNLVRDHGKSRRLSFWRKLVGLEENGASLHERVATPQPSAERVLLAREQLDAVWTAASSLSRQQRAVFLLRFAEEMSLADIADVLGLKVGSVKGQLFRALGKVRGALKEQKSR
jgi:RNA polymerase sigma-70 factor (ECF subfamily)